MLQFQFAARPGVQSVVGLISSVKPDGGFGRVTVVIQKVIWVPPFDRRWLKFGRAFSLFFGCHTFLTPTLHLEEAGHSTHLSESSPVGSVKKQRKKKNTFGFGPSSTELLWSFKAHSLAHLPPQRVSPSPRPGASGRRWRRATRPRTPAATRWAGRMAATSAWPSVASRGPGGVAHARWYGRQELAKG